MVSDEMLFNYPYWKIRFTVHTDASGEKMVSIISQNNKPIYFSQ